MDRCENDQEGAAEEIWKAVSRRLGVSWTVNKTNAQLPGNSQIPVNPPKLVGLTSATSMNLGSTLSIKGPITIESYKLVHDGNVSVPAIHYLIRQFSVNYHAYLPVVPTEFFEPYELDRFFAEGESLLTAVLCVASKDCTAKPDMHLMICRYMQELIAGIVAGLHCTADSVEALLILSEWEPFGLRNGMRAFYWAEDRAAWTHLGIAVRVSSSFGLNPAIFSSKPLTDVQVNQRARTGWITCYIADRMLSVRLGKTFWSCGPPALLQLGEDFPVMSAMLELAQMFANAHEVLCQGLVTNRDLLLSDECWRYVNEFGAALDSSQQHLCDIDCLPQVVNGLTLSAEYLKLYVYSFGVQAFVLRALATHNRPLPTSFCENLCRMFRDVGRYDEAKYFWNSFKAATTILVLLMKPVEQMQYMPLRFYAYGVQSAIFLSKAVFLGIVDLAEELRVRSLMREFQKVLKNSSVSSQDLGFRYAMLINSLLIACENCPSRNENLQHMSAKVYDAAFSAIYNFDMTDAFFPLQR